MLSLDDIQLKIIKDSRKEDTLEVLMVSGKTLVKSSVPHGKSRGEREVVFLAPQESLVKFQTIKNHLLHHPFQSLSEFDNFLLQLDGTPLKARLGGNLTLVLSQAFSKLYAQINHLPLWEFLRNNLVTLMPQSSSFVCYDPYPYFFFNLINAGQHAPYGPKFQEYLIVPKEENPQKALALAKNFFFHLKNFMKDRYNQEAIGDEGGLLVKSDDYTLPLEILSYLRYQLGLEEHLNFALDIAASSFFDKTTQTYKIQKDKSVTKEALLEIYKTLQTKYGLLSLEDPFEENDFRSFNQLNSLLSKQAVVIGDDLTTTNETFLQKAINEKAITGVIIKPSQIGTISETLRVIALALTNNLKIIVSHRSAETNDDFISDLAVACCAWGFKAGAPQPEERMVKYNRIIEIFNSF